MLDHKNNFYLISLNILITCLLNNVCILWGEVTCKSLLGVKGLNRREVICWSIVCTRKCFFIDNDSENNLVWRWCLLNNSWCFVTLLQQSYIFKIFHVINIFHVMLIFWLFLLFFQNLMMNTKWENFCWFG